MPEFMPLSLWNQAARKVLVLVILVTLPLYYLAADQWFGKLSGEDLDKASFWILKTANRQHSSTDTTANAENHSTATSGSTWKGVKIREFPPERLQQLPEPSSLPSDLSRYILSVSPQVKKCSNWAVVTTIFNVSTAVSQTAKLLDKVIQICFYVVHQRHLINPNPSPRLNK